MLSNIPAAANTATLIPFMFNMFTCGDLWRESQKTTPPLLIHFSCTFGTIKPHLLLHLYTRNHETRKADGCPAVS